MRLAGRGAEAPLYLEAKAGAEAKARAKARAKATAKAKAIAKAGPSTALFATANDFAQDDNFEKATGVEILRGPWRSRTTYGNESTIDEWLG